MEDTEKKIILLVDDEPDLVTVLKKRIESSGYSVLTASNGSEALQVLEKTIPNLILLDIMMPVMDGIETCNRIKGNKYTSMIPIIFLSAKGSVTDKIQGLKEGVQDYIAKPVDSAELIARMESVLKTNENYKAMSLRDELTGLYNYTFFVEEFSHSFEMARRYNRVFSLIIIDIDNFKKLNDTYGHLCGNFVLQSVGEKIKATIRRVDLVTRYAGDEFAVILPETNQEQVIFVVNRIKSIFTNLTLDYKEQKISVKASVGSSTYLPSMGTKEILFDAADKNMYEEKETKK
jgi:diguanylate cyclase (GGDEF)-like protein